MTDPPVLPTERSDAARNRRLVLEAAERLFAARGVEAVSMDAIAAEAGVGKGTLYRRFGDRAGLALALLDARERELQEAILRGPPPLGPGAPAGERLVAFVEALCGLLERATDLLVEAENASVGARYRQGVYRAWRLHARVLLRQAGAPVDAEVAADALMGALAADLYRHLRRERGFSAERVRAGVVDVARALTGARPDP
jgi:AcrR family transcriptional regulator